MATCLEAESLFDSYLVDGIPLANFTYGDLEVRLEALAAQRRLLKRRVKALDGGDATFQFTAEDYFAIAEWSRRRERLLSELVRRDDE
jgi:hypothetical protein